MNNDDKLKVNIAAAELLGLSSIIAYRGCVFHKHSGMNDFNIFTHNVDCLAVVKKLGSLKVCIDKEDESWFFWYNDFENKERFNTYEEAVAAAVLDVHQLQRCYGDGQ